MRRPRTLTDEEICALYAAGLDGESIGFRAGCSGTTALDIVRAAGHPIRGPGGRAGAPLQLTDDQIITRYKAGQSGMMLAAAAGCVPATIYNILRRAGVPLRSRTGHRRAGGKFAKP